MKETEEKIRRMTARHRLDRVWRLASRENSHFATPTEPCDANLDLLCALLDLFNVRQDAL